MAVKGSHLAGHFCYHEGKHKRVVKLDFDWFSSAAPFLLVRG
jgi:hypothetical protein